VPVSTPKRRVSADERRALLLEAGGRVVAEHGITGVTTERVAAEAGVSRALLYLHFANVPELLAAMAQEEQAYVDDRLRAALAMDAPFDEKLSLAIEPYVTARTERGEAFRALVIERSTIEAVAQVQLARYVEVIGLWRDEARRAMGVDRATAEAAAVTLIGGFEAAARYWWMTPGVKPEKVIAVFRTIVDASLRALADGVG
jgi:AcrR family transcriptional regulator